MGMTAVLVSRYVRTVGLNTTPATPQEKQDKTLFFSVPL